MAEWLVWGWCFQDSKTNHPYWKHPGWNKNLHYGTVLYCTVLYSNSTAQVSMMVDDPKEVRTLVERDTVAVERQNVPSYHDSFVKKTVDLQVHAGVESIKRKTANERYCCT